MKAHEGTTAPEWVGKAKRGKARQSEEKSKERRGEEVPSPTSSLDDDPHY